MQAVIMAAGECSRFWPLNLKHKTLIKLLGEPIIFGLVKDLRRAGIKDIIIVRYPKTDIEKEIGKEGIKYVVQSKPTGEGDALLRAEHLINSEQFFAVNADQQDVDERLPLIINKFKKSKNKLIVIGSPTKTPWIFGIFKLKGERVLEIVEKPIKGKEPSNIKNIGDYFLPKDIFKYLKRIPSHPYSSVWAVFLYAKENPVGLVRLKKETAFLKYPWNLFEIMKSKMAKPGFKSFISPSAKVGKNAVISGRVYISDGVRIGENTVISGPCYIGKNCEIGANNVLRGPINLEKGVKTGAFMEIKSSIIEENTHFHSGYLGDSIIGPNCRFGGGFVSANRRLDRKNIFSEVKGQDIDTGLTYFGAVIGANTKFGIHCGIMPGVFVGSNCIVGPGSLIFENIPDKKFVRLNRQIVKITDR